MSAAGSLCAGGRQGLLERQRLTAGPGGGRLILRRNAIPTWTRRRWGGWWHSMRGLPVRSARAQLGPARCGSWLQAVFSAVMRCPRAGSSLVIAGRRGTIVERPVLFHVPIAGGSSVHRFLTLWRRAPPRTGAGGRGKFSTRSPAGMPGILTAERKTLPRRTMSRSPRDAQDALGGPLAPFWRSLRAPAGLFRDDEIIPGAVAGGGPSPEIGARSIARTASPGPDLPPGRGRWPL